MKAVQIAWVYLCFVSIPFSLRIGMAARRERKKIMSETEEARQRAARAQAQIDALLKP